MTAEQFCIYRGQHTHPHPWTLGTAPEVTEVIRLRQGGVQVIRRCTNCGARSGAIPKDVVLEWMGSLGAPHIRDGLVYTHPDCTYRGCDQPGVDMHHFAPRNTFGADADNWPVMPLCPQHHREWHARMDGYRRNARGVVA